MPSGVPLRLYLTRRISKRPGAPAEAKLIEPVYAFDREVIPAGTTVLGKVSKVESVSTWARIRTAIGGDFTPIHIAQVQFTTLALPDGRKIAVDTLETPGLNTLYSPPPPPKKKASQTSTGGAPGTARQKAKGQIDAQIAERKAQVYGALHGPNRKERLYDLAMSKLPYHPQYVRAGTRFDAELRAPLAFGSETVPPGALATMGTQPPPDSMAHARLLTALNSASARKGQPVEGVTTEPLFSPDRKLILPTGTRLVGTVVFVRPARWLHRSGQLRFSFQSIDLPQEAAQLVTPPPAAAAPERTMQTALKFRTQAVLQSAEASGTAPAKVDREGGIKAQDSKKRFLAPLASLVIARAAGDNDMGRHHASGASAGSNTNVSGRTLGGASGFGLLGAAASQSSPYVGAALGYYGLAWSVYSNVFARGPQIQFDKDAMIDIRFNGR